SPGKAHRIACIRRARLCVMILRSRDASVRLDGTTMKCILVPIDFSDVTPPVIDVARQLAKALDAEIHLVHVKEFTAAATPGTHGHGAMYNLLVGSATKGVLKHSTHPVLLVPAPKSS